MKCAFILLISLIGWLAQGGTYTIDFTATANQNPLRDGTVWTNGLTEGLDWSNMAVTNGRAYGLQVGHAGDPINDGLATISGTWLTTTCRVSAVISMPLRPPDSFGCELELHACFTLTNHWAEGLEFLCSTKAVGTDCYAAIVQWNGTVGNFTPLIQQFGATYIINDGDTMTGTVTNGVAKLFINGVEKISASCSPIAGSPGIGMYTSNASSTNSNFGFSSFTATDGQGGVIGASSFIQRSPFTRRGFQ
jgi:hypothetical protein